MHERNPSKRPQWPFHSLLKDMVKEDGFLILDPVVDSVGEFFDRILSKPAMHNLTEVVQDFVSPEMLEVLRTQLVKDKYRLTWALQQGDIELLRYKLIQLRKFNKCVNMKMSQDAVEDITEQLRKIITQYMDQYDLCFSMFMKW